MSRRSGVYPLILLTVLLIACRAGNEERNDFLTGGLWKINTLRTDLPQWMVKWDSAGFEKEVNHQYFETLSFSDDGKVEVMRYRDVPDTDTGMYYYDKGSWVYSDSLEVLLLELTGGHEKEKDVMRYKAEYQVDRISADTLRLTRIRVIAKQGDFRDH
jgi:hypothetical protein